MARRGLILYASAGGNTEKVALRFKKVFEKKGWGCDILKVTKENYQNSPYMMEDYDLLCVGSPIWQGIPLKEIFDDHLGILMPTRLFRNPPDGFGSIEEPFGPKKGIAFVTYAGERCGPPEAMPAIDCLAMRMQDMRIKCIGKFACPGGPPKKHLTHLALDTVADKKGWGIEQTTQTVMLYQENPEHPDFADLSKEDRELFDWAIKEEREHAPGRRFASRGWHWDIQNRPSERDLLKAEIFMEEILEDYYGGGVNAAPLAQYICIA